jgi:hypothetical protein
MIDPANVSAVLVTRGNVPMDRIVASIEDAGIEDIVVWDNSVHVPVALGVSRQNDLGCFGRYAAIDEVDGEFVYHQDDDLIAPVADILASYNVEKDSHRIVANCPLDEEWRLTGRGSVFHRSLAHFESCFGPYIERYGEGPEFNRICDIVFAYMNSYHRIDLGHTDLPWASEPGSSMYLEPDHYVVREQARARVAALNKERGRWQPSASTATDPT